jgi:IS5 family transposase
MARFLMRILMTMRDYQPSFFDESQRLTLLTKLNDPLAALLHHIDFETFRPILDQIFLKPRKSPAGRKPLDRVMMFKALILQCLYNLSDPQVEYQITDRLSFTRFLGLHIGETIPDFSTLWRFREALVKSGAALTLFDTFNARLEAQGVFATGGSIIDATLVEVPRQRNSREENAQVKAGHTPEAWKSNPHKLSQKDIDARWTKKNGVNSYGYKNHVKTHRPSLFIRKFRVTPANVHDSKPLPELIDEEDRDLHADSAYKSAETDQRLEELGIKNHIHEKGTRGAKLSAEQKASNLEKSRIRAFVEHVFAFMENSMNGIRLRTIGLKRAECLLGLANLTYNLCRYSQLIRLGHLQPA